MPLLVIWQYMDRSIFCHMTLSAMHYLLYSSLCTNRIDGIMVSVLDSSGADCGIKTGGIKLKTIQLVFVAFPLSTQH
jgi:hypothetical protein